MGGPRLGPRKVLNGCKYRMNLQEVTRSTLVVGAENVALENLP